MTKTNRLIALIISFVMIFSMFAVCVSATEQGTTAPTEQGTTTPTEQGTTAPTEKPTTAPTEKPTEDHSGHDHDGNGIPDDQEKTVSKGEIITNIVVIGIIVIVAAILIIKFRVKLAAFLRSVKSELKKIVWASGKDTRKNFLVVIVITVSIAILIGLLDFAFEEGIQGIVNLLRK